MINLDFNSLNISTNFLTEILSVSSIAIVMVVSPGPDFAMVARNSISFSRSSGLWSSLGISLAIWLHVIYSIAGIGLIISQSQLLFNLLKFAAAAYLIYIGLKSFSSKDSPLNLEFENEGLSLSRFDAFKMGFITNALNPKTTIFFISIFTQVINSETPLAMQLIYGYIISAAHLIWFAIVSLFLTSPAVLRYISDKKNLIEKIIGLFLCAFAAKIAF